MRLRFWIGALMSAALLLSSGPAALADDEPAPPDTAAAAAAGGTDVLEGLSVAEGAGTQACKWARVERWRKNVFGIKLFSYFQEIDWCYNGSRVTSRTRTRWAEVHFPGWAFKGHILSQTSGGPGSTFYQARTQGHFCLAEYFSCVQNVYPWIDMTVRGSGSWSYSSGG